MSLLIVLVTCLVSFCQTSLVKPGTSCHDDYSCVGYNQVCINHQCYCELNYKWSDSWSQCQHFDCERDADCFIYDQDHECDWIKGCQCKRPLVSNSSDVLCAESTLDRPCRSLSLCDSDPNQYCNYGYCRCLSGYHSGGYVCRPDTYEDQPSYWWVYVLCFVVLPAVVVALFLLWRRRNFMKQNNTQNVVDPSTNMPYPRQSYAQPPRLSIPVSTYPAQSQLSYMPHQGPYAVSGHYANIQYPAVPPVQYNEPPPSYDSLAGTSRVEAQPAINPAFLDDHGHQIHSLNMENPDNIYQNLPRHHFRNPNDQIPAITKQEQLSGQL